MKTKIALIAIALLLLAGGLATAQVGPPNSVLCNQMTTGSTTSQVVTAATGKRIFICGWNIEATAATSAWTLVAGTGTVCNASVATLVAYSALPAGAVVVDHPIYAFTNPAATSNVCVTTNTTVNWILYWGQY